MSKILLDSADINKAKEIAKYYSIAGITTNQKLKSLLMISMKFTFKRLKILHKRY